MVGTVRRRLSVDERRDQLTLAAMEELAARGYAELSLEGIAERAGVTRNLLYHYFPRRKLDALLAAVQRAVHEVTHDWVTDDAVPVEERLTTNMRRLVEHATGPSLAWQCLRRARASQVPEAMAISQGVHGVVVANIATNHLGTADPSPLQSAALHAYVVFAEEMLERWRSGGFELDAAVAVLRQTLLGVVAAVR